MIASIHGKLVESLPMRVVVDVQGIGYEIHVPLSTFEKLPMPGAEITMLTHLQVREDEHSLYGFYSREERDLFKMLIHHVSGIGPKLALQILSGCSVDQFRLALMQSDVAFLSRIKGVGKKTAERLVVELRDKMSVSSVPVGTPVTTTALSPELRKQNDALLALMALGYKQPDALKALQNLPNTLSVEEMVKEALKKI
jgi:Holliday junction DNA helicase RuvA